MLTPPPPPGQRGHTRSCSSVSSSLVYKRAAGPKEDRARRDGLREHFPHLPGLRPTWDTSPEMQHSQAPFLEILILLYFSTSAPGDQASFKNYYKSLALEKCALGAGSPRAPTNTHKSIAACHAYTQVQSGLEDS